MAESPLPVQPRPSASLVIGRDGAVGWEIFMARRHNDTAFAGGALVFPGGALEAGDETGAVGEAGAGDETAAVGEAGAVDWLHAHRLAAIRETFEEVGILYARHADGTWPAAALLAMLGEARAALAGITCTGMPGRSLIVQVLKSAEGSAAEATQQRMSEVAGGMNLPPGFKLPF